ncbi:MAG: flagellin-like protein [Sphingomonas bacterium]|jgi:flagellin-like hook-associated protein FlgL|nr:flagellin-like protein [Sphingomonas bacterium]
MISGSAFNINAEISRQQALSQQIAQLQTDISTGIKVHVASDDPAAAARIAAIRISQADNTVYSSNIDRASATASLVDTNLGSVQTSLDRAKELMLSASNGTLNASDRAAIVTELQGIQQDLQSYSQQTDSSGNPLYATDTPLAIPIDRTTSIAANESYDTVFGKVTMKDGSTTSLNDMISSAITAVTNNDATGMSTSLGNLDASQTQVTTARADVGVRESRLTAASDRLANAATDLTDERGGLEGTDVTAAYATLSQKMTTLSAAQTVLSQLSQTSLFQKLG